MISTMDRINSLIRFSLHSNNPGFKTRMLYPGLQNLIRALWWFSDKTNNSLKGIFLSYFSGFSSKGNSKIEEKSKKAVSRLSHQFFGKSGNPEENMKSKKKTRQTVSTFGFDYKKDFLPSKNEEPIPNYENNQFLRPINV